MVVFWLPPESPSKIILGMNIFTAFFLLLLLLAELVPTSTNEVPYIGKQINLFCSLTSSSFMTIFLLFNRHLFQSEYGHDRFVLISLHNQCSLVFQSGHVLQNANHFKENIFGRVGTPLLHATAKIESCRDKSHTVQHWLAARKQECAQCGQIRKVRVAQRAFQNVQRKRA